jgi:galactokinase
MMKDKKVKEAFKKEFGGEFRFFEAPGRINLIGEHTDYNEGFVLPAAIDKKIYLAISPLKGSLIKIYALDLDQYVEINIHETVDKMPHWAKYPYGVVKEIQAAGYLAEGFQAVFGGDIPEGAGLSSSAALESVFIKALNVFYKLEMDEMQMARIGQQAEHIYAGVKCGIMDQFASLFGKAGYAMKLDCRTMDYAYIPLQLKDHELILADTRVKHNLASTEYNRRRADCEEGVIILQSQMPNVKSLRDVCAKDVYPYKNILGEQIFLRCEYVTEENQRVLDTCQKLAEGDLKGVGQLLYESHEGLSKKYHVSCHELDLLVDIAKQTDGVLGARMMGGGFGGCTLNLVETHAVAAFKENCRAAFEKTFGLTPLFYNVTTANGAGEVE